MMYSSSAAWCSIKERLPRWLRVKARHWCKEQLTASELPEIAFSGRSNVGKSSLLNKLLNRKNLARVSSVPGKTVTINFFKGDGVRFVDLPGYGYAKVAKSEKLRWATLMEEYFSSDRDIRMVVQLVDLRHPPSKDDMDMIDFLYSSGYDFVVAATKSDKLNKTQYNERCARLKEELSAYPGVTIIPFSSLKGEGVEELKKQIERVVE